MSTPREKRLTREIDDIRKDKSNSGIKVRTVNDSIEDLIGTFPGPQGTPYEGGTFEVAIKVPRTYPFAPLEMKLITKCWHPNISSQTGAICLSTLKEGWSPVLTIRTTLVSLQSLLSTPEPSDPQDATVAAQFINDPNAFSTQARYWTSVARELADSAGITWSDVEKFGEMGFEQETVVRVLSSLGYRGSHRGRVGDEEVLEKLLGA